MMIKASLDEAKKADLRRSHFDVGGESYKIVSQMKSSFRPMSANVAMLNKEKLGELRASHWGVGEKSST
jgi:hypothetical protein